MSFGEHKARLEELVRDFAEQEERDTNSTRDRISEIMNRGTDTEFHRLARETQPVKMPEPEGVFDTGAGSGRPRTITDFSSIDPDVMSFGRLKDLFDSAIKKQEVSTNGIIVFNDIIQQRQDKELPDSTTLDLLRSLFKKEFIDQEFVRGKIAQRGKQYTDTLLQRAEAKAKAKSQM